MSLSQANAVTVPRSPSKPVLAQSYLSVDSAVVSTTWFLFFYAE